MILDLSHLLFGPWSRISYQYFCCLWYRPSSNPCYMSDVLPCFLSSFAATLGPFLGGISGQESTCYCRRHKRWRFHPWVRKIPGRGYGNTLQYSCLENPMDREAWWSTVHGVPKSQIRLKLLNMHAGPFYSKCGTETSIISITGWGGGLVRNAESQALMLGQLSQNGHVRGTFSFLLSMWN